MKSLHAVNLVLLLLLACFAPAPATRELNLRAAASDSTRVVDNATTERLLRAHSSGKEEQKEEEERAISINFPSLEKILKKVTSGKSTELQGMLKADEALGSAFKTLKLSTMRIGKDDTKMVAKFLSSRNFKIWSQHAVKINKDDPYGEMLKALTNVFGEKNVAMMILVGNLSRNSRDVAKKLEKAQFYKWYFVDKYKTADEVFTNVLKADRNRIHGYGREKEIWGDYAKYVTTTVMKY
ncbi:hypothetical protein GN244_ATG13908 [Phytophthora infestans]|uniref:RxLR effector protein n=1 Tax=Phytophthora infestans TaxID=4787 RepID=A0A833SYX5_PHYIN|nr:hypothetical protein GN244_ATG13908 [Phytophthora infestans]KAF4131859.1 hypothetical protein GN958_ATG18892 [Phytophthora infestans]KAI9979568.1 hypothetical protein PInf_028974 [Phytophthora infestans]